MRFQPELIKNGEEAEWNLGNLLGHGIGCFDARLPPPDKIATILVWDRPLLFCGMFLRDAKDLKPTFVSSNSGLSSFTHNKTFFVWQGYQAVK